ncbi:excisionase [Ruoffia tabacinasalis]|uniref:excisionase n=1 Tax=Ruoffia tabacinasalis TaxID=87458 RepID=UPI002F421702
MKDKPLLAIKEAALLYNIGENKLRYLTDEPDCSFVLFVGNKRIIKRLEFDRFIYNSYSCICQLKKGPPCC